MKNIFTTFFLLSCLITVAQDNVPDKPNIIFILADDLGWADLPVYGNTFNEAPHLQKLALQGALFTNAYAASPVCSPSRASIQTGQYPARIGINDFLPGHWRPYEQLRVPSNSTQYLPLDYLTIGEVLQQDGYATAYFGKWHLGFHEKHSPENQGYGTSVVYNGGGFFNYAGKMKPAQSFPKGTVLSAALTDLSLDFIKANKKDPFFLFVSHYDVHVQLDAQNELIEYFLDKTKSQHYPSNAVYAAMIKNLDTSVGRMMDMVDDLGISENTIFIFFSDNGGLKMRFDKKPLIDKRSLHYYANDTLRYIASSNKPLKGEKGTLYEGGIRAPLIIKWPGKVEPGTVRTDMVSSIDFFPTLLNAAFVPKPDQQIIDGQDMFSKRNMPSQTPRTLFWHYPVYHHDVPASAIRKGDWKLIHFLDDGHTALYNLATDIDESENLAKKEKDKARELLAELNRWREDIKAAMPRVNPAFDPSKRNIWIRHPDFDKLFSGN